MFPTPTAGDAGSPVEYQGAHLGLKHLPAWEWSKQSR